MDIRQIGSRGYQFRFDDLKDTEYDCYTNVFAIVGKDNFIVCDTYLGASYMDRIANYLTPQFGHKKWIAFNSHGHWDHIWGNEWFKDHLIIAHEKTMDYIKDCAVYELEEHRGMFQNNPTQICLPHLTFENKIAIGEEGIEIFYSPGHTEDSASLYDSVDQTLFAGDNIDNPLPTYICWNNMNTYIRTLEAYRQRDIKHVVTGHTEPMDREIIAINLDYLKKVQSNEKINFSTSWTERMHQINLEFLGK
ncbi:MBL fold metallo-hydrolase [Vallitalea okinawensis]|uniref:MBL fold metallo-hydrolase n=1 Tax=Vallitalea okinawensis TaxID=2078660 RepID=UPI000CFD30F5|nr:MBL fold metallo-hydrolase [Vallitalea okinawensis]